MKKAIIFDLWETLGTKNIGISDSLQKKFDIKKTSDFMHLYENAVQIEKWDSEEKMAINFLKEFKIEESEQNIKYITDLFRKSVEKATMFNGMKELLFDLKKNYKLGFISNTTVFESVILDKWGIRDIFDVVSFSWELGVKKPTNSIFEITLNKLQVKPEEAIFVDDGKNNVLKAKELGLHVILFTSIEQLKQELLKLEIKLG